MNKKTFINITSSIPLLKEFTATYVARITQPFYLPENYRTIILSLRDAVGDELIEIVL